jgi:hypothetical protein
MAFKDKRTHQKLQRFKDYTVAMADSYARAEADPAQYMEDFPQDENKMLKELDPTGKAKTLEEFVTVRAKMSPAMVKVLNSMAFRNPYKYRWLSEFTRKYNQ